MKKDSVPSSLNNSLKALGSLLKTLYKGMPVLMITFTLLVIYLASLLGNNLSSMMLVLSIVIIICSICVYVKSRNYGEAVLALSAGLLTVYTVEWTKPLYISFIVIWVLFTLVVFLVSSIRLSSRLETIYLEASFSLNGKSGEDKAVRARLQSISSSVNNSILSPTESAEVLRLLCYRKIPIEKMQISLKWVNIYTAITNIEYLDIASFVVEIIKSTSFFDTKNKEEDIFEYVYTAMRNAPVSPKEFIEGFQKTRYILVSSKQTILFFKTLQQFFDSGLPFDEIEQYVSENVIFK